MNPISLKKKKTKQKQKQQRYAAFWHSSSSSNAYVLQSFHSRKLYTEIFVKLNAAVPSTQSKPTHRATFEALD